jgi:uncharacterized protein GlcG (DUF336 family)
VSSFRLEAPIEIQIRGYSQVQSLEFDSTVFIVSNSNKLIGIITAAAACLVQIGCGDGSQRVDLDRPETAGNQLVVADVQAIVQNAAASVDAPFVVAVTDRGGNILAVFRKPGAPVSANGDFGATVSTEELAVGLARTASFFSNNQAPLSSRTVRFISGIHFPPDVAFTASAPLYGIENTNRGCPLNVSFLAGQALNPARSIGGAGLGTGIVTGKADNLDSNPDAVNPGGVPLFRNGEMIGGVGVAGTSPDVAEFAAFSAAVNSGFGAAPASPGVVVIDGISLPFVEQIIRPPGFGSGSSAGAFTVGPLSSAGAVPSGDLIGITPGPLGGLSQAEVQNILDAAVTNANQTRAVIRLPAGQPAKFAIAIADLDGSIIGLRRMSDSTVFSVDVAVAKARNVIYFSSPNPDLPGVSTGTAVTNRTIGFGAQPLFPSGINGTAPGPFFPLYQFDLANPCTNGHQPASANQNGVVFFPGSLPLYRNGVLIGGLGISGDGVDQDDYVTAKAAAGFEAPDAIRADQVQINNVRLPYLKFPRNPTL